MMKVDETVSGCHHPPSSAPSQRWHPPDHPWTCYRPKTTSSCTRPWSKDEQHTLCSSSGSSGSVLCPPVLPVTAAAAEYCMHLSFARDDASADWGIFQPFKALFHEVFLRPGPITLGGSGAEHTHKKNGRSLPPKISANFMKEKWSKTSKFGCDQHSAPVNSLYFECSSVTMRSWNLTKLQYLMFDSLRHTFNSKTQP